MTNQKLSKDQIEQIEQMVELGVQTKQIAHKLGINRSTVYRYLGKQQTVLVHVPVDQYEQLVTLARLRKSVLGAIVRNAIQQYLEQNKHETTRAKVPEDWATIADWPWFPD